MTKAFDLIILIIYLITDKNNKKALKHSANPAKCFFFWIFDLLIY